MVKLPRISISVNFLKVIAGVAFSLGWGRVMYSLWPQPSYWTFIWFYLAVGGVVLKWVLFEIIDRLNMRARVRKVTRELEESRTRVREADSRKER